MTKGLEITGSCYKRLKSNYVDSANSDKLMEQGKTRNCHNLLFLNKTFVDDTN